MQRKLPDWDDQEKQRKTLNPECIDDSFKVFHCDGERERRRIRSGRERRGRGGEGEQRKSYRECGC